MSFGVTELIIILIIIMLLFGTKKLRSIGTDLGGALKGFRSAMHDDMKEEKASDSSADGTPVVDKKSDPSD